MYAQQAGPGVRAAMLGGVGGGCACTHSLGSTGTTLKPLKMK